VNDKLLLTYFVLWFASYTVAIGVICLIYELVEYFDKRRKR